MTKTKIIQGFVAVLGDQEDDFVSLMTFRTCQYSTSSIFDKAYLDIGYDVPSYRVIPATLTVEMPDE